MVEDIGSGTTIAYKVGKTMDARYMILSLSVTHCTTDNDCHPEMVLLDNVHMTIPYCMQDGSLKWVYDFGE